MKIKTLNSIAAAGMIFLLAACGQELKPDNDAKPEEIQISTTGEAVNRDWIPAGVILPQPHVVLQDTKIGTRTYLLQVSVAQNPSEMFGEWKSALAAAGYQVNDTSVPTDGRLMFEGADVESGQIAVSQPEDVDGYMIQIDVSKRAQ